MSSIQTFLLTVIFSIPGLLPSIDAIADNVVSDEAEGRFIADDYFGMHVRWGATTYFWPQARFNSWRVISSETTWYALEPEKGLWRFDALDKAVERAEWKGVEVLYTLGYPARWAADTDQRRKWNPGYALPPRDMADWDSYLRRLVSRYKGRIKYYELMNEPHFTELDGGWHSTRDFQVATMVEMARIAFNVIRQIDPEAKLLSMAPSGGKNGVHRINAFLKAGGGKYIDAISFHFYSDEPEDIPTLVGEVRKVLAENRLSTLPIWNTESGFHIETTDLPKPKLPSGERSHSQAMGGAITARSLILGAASGLQRFYWYSWDIPSMALTEGKGKTITAAGYAYIKTERWLRGATITECRSANEMLWICTLQRGTRQAHVVWNTTGTIDWHVPVKWQARHYEPLLNGWSSIKSGGQVRLSEAPMLIVPDEPAWGMP